MKTIIRVTVLAALVIFYQACGPKKENTEEVVTEEQPMEEEPAHEMTHEAEAPMTKTDAATTNDKTFVDASGVTVYNQPEVAPEYEGGTNAMVKYLKNNLSYPANGTEEGTVFVSFIVSQDGTVRDAKVENGPEDPALREEAVRVISGMPKWVPGKQGGKAVHTKFTAPITFKKG